MRVLISAHCRTPELFPAAKLVFDTIRTGFPTAEIIVCANDLAPEQYDEIETRCKAAGATLVKLVKGVQHATWVQGIFDTALDNEEESFALCDTDIIFWKQVEDWKFSSPLAGQFIPTFYDDQFTKCLTQARLHTALLFVNPVLLKAEIDKYHSRFPKTQYNPPVNMIRPFYMPIRVGSAMQTVFFDVCGMLYNAIGGTAFNESQLDCYDHLQCGSFSDLVSPGLHGRNLHLLRNPKAAKGLWKKHSEFYKTHSP